MDKNIKSTLKRQINKKFIGKNFKLSINKSVLFFSGYQKIGKSFFLFIFFIFYNF